MKRLSEMTIEELEVELNKAIIDWLDHSKNSLYYYYMREFQEELDRRRK